MTQPVSAILKLQRLVHSKIKHLTPTERFIATYLVEHTSDIAFLSVQELAKRLQKGPASIMRVVNKLGYKGYSILKDELQAEIQNGIAPLERFKLTVTKQNTPIHLEIHTIAHQEVQNINTTLTLFNEGSFEKAAQLIAESQEVITLGLGVSSYLAEIAAYLFRRIGIRSYTLPQTGLKCAEHLVHADQRDVLLAFSLPPYSPETITAAAFARTQGARVVAFSNQAAAPIAEHANVLLVAKTESPFLTNSLSAIFVLLSALVARVEETIRPKSTEAIKKAVELRKGSPAR